MVRRRAKILSETATAPPKHPCPGAMREVEIKIALKSFDVIALALNERGVSLGSPMTQDDIWFAKPETIKSFAKFQSQAIALRIRQENGQATLTLKQPQTNSTDNIELESGIDDAKIVQAMLEKIDFKEVVRVHKTRREARVDGIKVCLDEVEGLGKFVEAEQLTDERSNPAIIQQQLAALLCSLTNRPKAPIITDSYSKLAFRRKHQGNE